jgi:hypothetical protein
MLRTDSVDGDVGVDESSVASVEGVEGVEGVNGFDRSFVFWVEGVVEINRSRMAGLISMYQKGKSVFERWFLRAGRIRP